MESKWTAVLGVILPNGEVIAKMGDVRSAGHEDLGMTQEEGKWRYLAANQVVFWWDQPDSTQKAVVQSWLENHGYPVLRHEKITAGRPSWGASHGYFIEQIVDALIS